MLQTGIELLDQGRIRTLLRSENISSAVRTVQRIVDIAHGCDPDLLKTRIDGGSINAGNIL